MKKLFLILFILISFINQTFPMKQNPQSETSCDFIAQLKKLDPSWAIFMLTRLADENFAKISGDYNDYIYQVLKYIHEVENEFIETEKIAIRNLTEMLIAKKLAPNALKKFSKKYPRNTILLGRC